MLIYRVTPSLIAMLCMCSVNATSAVADSLSATRQQELLYLLKQDCGSCHGLTLRGGLGPALTAEAIKDKSLQAMVATIRYGRPGTPMPPWANQLTEAEIQWLVEQLYKGVE